MTIESEKSQSACRKTARPAPENKTLSDLLTDCKDHMAKDRSSWFASWSYYDGVERVVDDPEALEEIEKIDSLVKRIDEVIENGV